jgi:arylsulfatase A-like enzyme
VLENGVPLGHETPTLATLLRSAGYACGYSGKWHLGNEAGLVPPGRHGFDESWVSTEDGYFREHATEGYSSYHQFLVARGHTPADVHRDGIVFSRLTAARMPEAAGKPAFQAGEAIRFLETYRDRPFFLMCNFQEPHPPRTGPYDDLYRPEAVALPESWSHEPEPTVPLRYRVRRRAYLEHNPYLTTNDARGWQELRARYWGLCTLVDTHAGRILQRLEELGLAEHTIVVYTTDHGDMMGEHRFPEKSLPYEGATRVPLLIRVPGGSARRVATPVSQVQLVPTLLDLLGQPVPTHLPGVSLRPLLEDGGGASSGRVPVPDEAEVVIEWNGRFDRLEELRQAGRLTADEQADPRLEITEVRTIRRGPWKLNVHASGEHELYDLEADPGELHNAFWDSGVQDVISELYVRLIRWQHSTGDTLALPDPLEGRKS